MVLNNTYIPDVKIICPNIHSDDRGIFFEVMRSQTLGKLFVQVNQSESKKNVLRGLHYQRKPLETAKLVRCISGEILDVAADIRRESKTFGKWISIRLSSENKKMIYIPEGFVHGFSVKSDYAIVEYMCTTSFTKSLDDGIAWNDPTLNINWELDEEPILSERDKHQHCL